MFEANKRIVQPLDSNSHLSDRPKKTGRSLTPFTPREKEEIAEILQVLAAAAVGGAGAGR